MTSVIVLDALPERLARTSKTDATAGNTLGAEALLFSAQQGNNPNPFQAATLAFGTGTAGLSDFAPAQ